MSAAIRTDKLVKVYGDNRAVDGVDLTVSTGEVFALLGPNGAGKTTTVEILEGHREATSGQVEVLGMHPIAGGHEFRSRIGIVLQTTAIEPELTVSEALDIYGQMYPRRRPTGELIELVGLDAKSNARIKTLSGGQQRRLELALGLVGDPDLIFLDEPTTGFDPSARRHAWTTIENLASLGKTILLTTHYMEESQRLADRIAIISGGRIIAEGTPQSLVQDFKTGTLIQFPLPDGISVIDLPITPTEVTDGVVAIRTDEATSALHRLTGWAMDRQIDLDHLTVTRPSLEDVYLGLTEDE